MEGHAHTAAVINRLSPGDRASECGEKDDGGRTGLQRSADTAVRGTAEIENTAKVILKDHIDHCLVRAVRENDETAVDRLKTAIDRLL